MSKKADVLGINIDAMTMSEVIAKAEQYMDEKSSVMIATANAEMIMRAIYDIELRNILCEAALTVPDGAGTVWAAHYLGFDMPERVAGYDLAQELMRLAPQKNRRVYFLGSAPGVADKAKRKAEKCYPGINIVGVHDGYFNEVVESEIIEDIKKKKPDLLLVALGIPKQEKWIYAHMKELGVPLSIGVGGTLDVMAGVMKRAPLWIQKARLEWLFRGILQPQRISRLLVLPRFVFEVCKYKNSEYKK